MIVKFLTGFVQHNSLHFPSFLANFQGLFQIFHTNFPGFSRMNSSKLFYLSGIKRTNCLEFPIQVSSNVVEISYFENSLFWLDD